MSISDPLVLPPDVMIIAVEQLSPEVRARLPRGDEPFAVTRPSVRSPSKLVDAHAADLLSRFDQPTTIVDAIIGYSKDSTLDPKSMLEAAYPVLQDCFNARFLVPADSPEADQFMPMLARDDAVGPYRVRRTIRVHDEVELHQVITPEGRSAVIKLMRPDKPEKIRSQFAHEANVLRHLAGRAAPRLVDQGQFAGNPWLVTDWCAGVSPVVAANAIRASEASDKYHALAALCCSIIEAYAMLHQAGVIHGDVNSSNVLVDREGAITLVDFGAAAITGSGAPEPARMWVAPYLDPSLASSLQSRTPSPPGTMLDEQYSVAALLYSLLTGNHYLDFVLDRDTMLRQILEDSPLPFSARGVPPWPGVEAVLSTALEKTPAKRHSSMVEFAHAFRRGAATAPSVIGLDTGAISDQVAGLLRTVTAAIGPGTDTRDFVLTRPASSLSNGAAGMAYACYRLACLDGDGQMLAQAERWLSRGASERGPASFETDELTPDTTGLRTPYHRESGLASVGALICQAQGDHQGLRQAVRKFINMSLPPDEALDLTTGRTGTLQGAALLTEMIPSDDPDLRAELLDFGRATARGIWDVVGGYGPVDRCDQLTSTGMAHGWAGILYAQMRWCQITGADLPQGLETRLGQLARLAEPTGRGARWPWRIDLAEQDWRMMSSWCNGTAGFVHLWIMAHRILGNPDYLELARSSGWNAFDDGDSLSNLCCGLAGRAYALLALYRESGDVEWRDRAFILAERAAGGRRGAEAVARQSLYKGDVGLALLAADLAHPEGAVMPFFGAEGWPSHGA